MIAALKVSACQAPGLNYSFTRKIEVVASLGGDLRRRDAEVAALWGQVNIERRLSGDDSDQACRER